METGCFGTGKRESHGMRNSGTATDDAERTMIGKINRHEVFKGKLPLGGRGLTDGEK